MGEAREGYEGTKGIEERQNWVKEGQIGYGKTKGMGKECRINYTKARKLEKK